MRGVTLFRVLPLVLLAGCARVSDPQPAETPIPATAAAPEAPATPPATETPAEVASRSARLAEHEKRIQAIIADRRAHRDARAAAAPPPPPVADQLPVAQPKVTIAIKDGRLIQAAAILSTQTNTQIRVENPVAGKTVSIQAESTPLESVLTTIAKSADIAWWRESDGSYTFGQADPGPLETRRIELDAVSAEEVLRGIQPLLSYSGRAKVAPDGNALLVTERPLHLMTLLPEINRVDPKALEGTRVEPHTPAMDELATIVISDGLITEAVKLLGSSTSRRFTVHGAAQGARTTLLVNARPLSEVLDTMTSASGLLWWEEPDGTIAISDREWYRENRFPGPKAKVPK